MVAIKAIFEIELDISRFTCRKVSAKIVPRQIWGLNSSEITEIRPASFSSHVPEPIKTKGGGDVPQILWLSWRK